MVKIAQAVAVCGWEKNLEEQRKYFITQRDMREKWEAGLLQGCMGVWEFPLRMRYIATQASKVILHQRPFRGNEDPAASPNGTPILPSVTDSSAA